MLVGGGAALTISALTLAIITFASRGAHAVAALIGAAGLVASGMAFRVATSPDKAKVALRARFEQGSPLALAEAKLVLDALEVEGALDDRALHKIIHQVHPAASPGR